MVAGSPSPATPAGDEPRDRGGSTGAVGCYPGSFNPPTVAHLAVAEAAVREAELVRLDLVVSRTALGKADLTVPTLAERIGVLEAIAATRPWLGVEVTDAELIVDIARSYDVVVMGADKWHQVNDPSWYGDSTAARDAALAALPRVLVAPRDLDQATTAVRPAQETGHPVTWLTLSSRHRRVSATALRDGGPEAAGWWLPEAAAFDNATGAWSDPDRYRATRN